jgi:hypothetical protein
MRIVFIWARLHQLSTFLVAAPVAETRKLDEYLWSEKLDALERQTLELFNSEALGNSPHPAFLKAFLNSVHIYIIQALREIPKGTSICRTLACRIQSGLELVDLYPFAAVCPDVLIWIVMVGGTGAPQEGPVRYWFNETLEELLEGLEFTLPDHIGGLGYFDITRQVLIQTRNKEARRRDEKIPKPLD